MFQNNMHGQLSYSVHLQILLLSFTQAVFSADFYGTSYAVFPTFTATEHLDISLNFRTYFEDGIIMFIGSAAQVCKN